jgi:hypothetical protein
MNLLTQHTSTINYTNKLLSYLALLLLSACYLHTIYEFSTITVWRHDSLAYLDHYMTKFKSEGRWINYYCFELLKQTQGIVAYCITSVSILFFFWRVALPIVKCRVYTAIFALIAVQFPFLTEQMLWPLTSYPAFIVLGLSALLVNRMPYYVFFPLFGILFSATLNSLYFLMPLLFLKNINLKKTIVIGVAWVLGFVFGYACSNLVVYLHTGEVIELARWRQAKHPDSLQDLINNFQYTFESLTRINHLLCDFIGRVGLVLCGLIFMLGCKLKRDSLFVLILLSCALAVFISVAPLGMLVPDRSGYMYALALLTLLFIREEWKGPVKSLHLIAMLYLGVVLSIANNQSINWYTTITGKVSSEFTEKLVPLMQIKNKIYLLPKPAAWRQLIQKVEYCEGVSHVAGENLASSMRIRPILRELKIHQVVECRGDICQNASQLSLNKSSCDNDMFVVRGFKNRAYGVYISGNYLH